MKCLIERKEMEKNIYIKLVTLQLLLSNKTSLKVQIKQKSLITEVNKNRKCNKKAKLKNAIKYIFYFLKFYF